MNVTLQLSDDQVEVIAERVAEIMLERSAADRRAESADEYMSVSAAAVYLGCTVGRVRKLIERKLIPYTQEGPSCRVFLSKTDLDHWMRQARRG